MRFQAKVSPFFSFFPLFFFPFFLFSFFFLFFALKPKKKMLKLQYEEPIAAVDMLESLIWVKLTLKWQFAPVFPSSPLITRLIDKGLVKTLLKLFFHFQRTPVDKSRHSEKIPIYQSDKLQTSGQNLRPQSSSHGGAHGKKG